MMVHHEILKEFYWRLSERKSLTIMTVVQNGPSRARRSVIEVYRWTLRKYFEHLRNRVSNNHDGFVGRTVESMTVRRWILIKDFETLKNRVSDNHDGCAGRTVKGTMVCRRVRRWTLGENKL